MDIQKRNAAAMGVESVRKKSSRWGSSSSSSSNQGVMDEDIRNAMEVEIRRLTEEEEFDKKIMNTMLEEEEVILQKIRNLLWVERVGLFELMRGVTDEEIRKEGEKIQKEIRKAIHEELDRLISMRIREKRRFVSMDEDIRNAMEAELRSREVQTYKYLMEMDRAEQIRDMRPKFVLHISPLEIIDNPDDQDFINVAADNINQTELVIIVTNHHSLRQYWTPRSAAAAATSSSSCRYHDDYLHPRDDDDEEMILAACRPLLDSPQRIKIILDQGVFAASDDDHEQHIILGSVDVLFQYSILPTYEHLEDLKRNITRSISEAKPHVLRVKPKRVRICVQVSRVQKQYYGSAEDATFDASFDDAHEPSACHPMDPF